MSVNLGDRKEIQNWIREKMPDMIRDLKRICRIRSVAETKGTSQPPYGQGCIDVLEEMLAIGKENGFETHNYDNYVGRISLCGKTDVTGAGENKDGGTEDIGIWAHLDVVDEKPLEDWDYEPYQPVVRNGYFIARGCQDNKSSAVMGLYALIYMKEHGIVPAHPMSLYLGTCEEQGMYELDYFLEHYQPPTLSLVPDSGFPVCLGERGSFNGELVSDFTCGSPLLEAESDCGQYTVPDRASITLSDEPGLWEKCANLKELFSAKREDGRIIITASGISTQASMPEKGQCAMTALAGLIVDNNMLPEKESEAFRLICEINGDHRGTALDVSCEDEPSGPMNLVATQLRLEDGHLVIGFISKYPITKNDFPFEERAGKAAEARGFHLKVTRLGKANYFEPDRQVVKRLTGVSNEVLNRQDGPFVMSGGTYARKLPNALAFGTGMPLPPAPEGMFRPGHGDYHQPDESIALVRMEKALEVYICGLLEIDTLGSLLE